MRLKIITISGVTFDDEVDMVLLPASEGEMGVIKHHMDMIVSLKKGAIKIHKGDKLDNIEVDGGIVSIHNGEFIDVMLG